MPRRLPLPPDRRLDWRDPNMPVIGKSGREIEAWKMVVKAQMAMNVYDQMPKHLRDKIKYAKEL